MKNTKFRGFTLLELLVAIVVVGVLAAIAFPNFIEQVRKGRRADGIAALQAVQQAQERYRSNNRTYAANLAALQPPTTTSPDGHYTLGLADVGSTGYTATAAPVAGSPQASDSRCGTLRLVQAAGDIRYEATGSGGAACWSR